MKILNENLDLPQCVSLILGFFDGVHLGHRKVIESAQYGQKTVLVTFSKSPAEFFNKPYSYLYPREKSYELFDSLGVDYLYEYDFSKIAELSAETYLQDLINKFHPQSITTGFNHTFGHQKSGDSNLLEAYQKKYGYKYNCVPSFVCDGDIVSSTLIKQLLKDGDIIKANKFLGSPFKIESTIIHGAKLGAKLGFPTANMIYPEKIAQIPYGVYKIKALGKRAVLNWGIKPTFVSDAILEVHIPNFSGNLYGKSLEIEILDRIRDEEKFNTVEDLKLQIKKDIEECLK